MVSVLCLISAEKHYLIKRCEALASRAAKTLGQHTVVLAIGKTEDVAWNRERTSRWRPSEREHGRQGNQATGIQTTSKLASGVYIAFLNTVRSTPQV
jgi:hypothetical protein